MKRSLRLRHLRLRSFDLSTDSGRSDERYRLALWSLIASVGNRALSMGVMVLGVGLTLEYLSPERFGVWMTIASFAAMLTFLDLGVGNALTNEVAKYAAIGDAVALRDAISGGLGFMAALGATTSMFLMALGATLPWHDLIKTSSDAASHEVVRATILFGALFGVSILSTGVQKVFVGMQRSFEAHLVSSIGSLAAIVGLLVATSHRADVPTLLLVTLGSQLLAPLLLLIPLLRRGQFSFAGLARKSCKASRGLLQTGSLFLVLQVGTMIGWGADSLLISSTLGASHVAVYGVMQRLLQFVSVPLSLANAPLWAAYADARFRGDISFVRQTLRRSLLLTLGLGTIGATLTVVAAPAVISRWTGGAVEVSGVIIGTFCTWVVLESLGNAFAMFLNAFGVIRPQVIAVIIFCVTALPLKLFLIHYGGIAGLLAATIVCYLASFPLLYFTLFRQDISRSLVEPAAARHGL